MTDELITRTWRRPVQAPITGQWITIEPLDWHAHGPDLAARFLGAENADLWDYMNFGPYETFSEFQSDYDRLRQKHGWMTFSIISNSLKETLGLVSFMRMRPEAGSAEVGCVLYSHDLQRTTGATEVIYLMGKHLFEDLEYRRFEWKCHNDNEASKRAALRFGFTSEGIFRKDRLWKGRNRDTAWFSIIDDEWPTIKEGFDAWLTANNFDDKGQQMQSLKTCRQGKL